MRNKVLARAVLCSVLMGSTLHAYAATADDYRNNSEYQAIGTNVLDTMHVAEAYAKGYTGAGITVGVVDDYVNFATPEFTDKAGNSYVDAGPAADYNWVEDFHGTHVAGIVAAAKNGVGMHGVAYAANVKSALCDINNINTYAFFYDAADIKILNNSWQTPDSYPYDLTDKADYDDYIAEIKGLSHFPYLAEATEHDKLLIFGAGNDGHTAPGPEAMYPYWSMLFAAEEGTNAALNANIINVTGINTTTYSSLTDTSGNTSSSLTYNAETGSFTATPYTVAAFSDLAQFAEDWTVAAPGYQINSANASYAANGSIDVAMNGTSMAAPMVSGVAALVQEAYPWLSAKQLGDVVLSTANNNITNNSGYYLTAQQDVDITDTAVTANYTFNVFYTGASATTSVVDAVEAYIMNNANIAEYIDARFFLGYVNAVQNSVTAEALLDELLKSENQKITKTFTNSDGKTVTITYAIQAYYNVPTDALFGQGIVDASKAVDGLAEINVRRLTSSDISSAYTVRENGKSTQTAQALYSVDTQGYNAVWSNDISEIRAGKIAEQPLDNYSANSSDYSDVADLAARYLYYTTNWGKEGSSNYYMVQEYIKNYNAYYEKQGLIGLHAGFYKAGDGVLVLAGKNTYQGSTIAAGGVLQIDGSVAGDAYSEGEGTIAGAGTINGSLYNNGNVMAGQALEVTYEEGESGQSGNELTVKGGLSGNGSITVNIFSDGETQTANVINVAGKIAEADAYGADISSMSLQAGTSAAPDATVTFLTATKGINAAAQIVEFSGLLNAEVSTNAEKTEAYLTTTASNNTGVQEATFAAVNELYNSLTSSEQQEMYGLYALNKENATTALNQLTGGLAEDMAHDAMQNRDVRTALREQEHLQRDEGLWMLLDKHWQRYDNTDGHGFTTTIGKDFFNNDSAYAGALFAYSTNSLSDKYDKGDYDNYTLGLYGGTKNAAGTWRGYVSYGLQDNSVNRNLSSLGRSARADYDSSTLGAGVRYSYDLQYGNEAKANHWHAVPYAQLNYTHYKQDGYMEKGAGVYERQVAGYSDDYADGELGLEIKRTDNYGSYGFSLGYRRILTGEQQISTAFFTGDGSRTSFTSAGTAEEKDHVVVGAYIGTKFSDKWSAAGQLQQDWSGNSNELHINLVFNYSF